jgi:hypothetical protein
MIIGWACTKLVNRLPIQEDFLNFNQSEHIMGPGSHVGFPISAKNKNLVYYHPMNISAKFDSNLFCGFNFNIEPYGKNV